MSVNFAKPGLVFINTPSYEMNGRYLYNLVSTWMNANGPSHSDWCFEVSFKTGGVGNGDAKIDIFIWDYDTGTKTYYKSTWASNIDPDSGYTENRVTFTNPQSACAADSTTAEATSPTYCPPTYIRHNPDTSGHPALSLGAQKNGLALDYPNQILQLFVDGQFFGMNGSSLSLMPTGVSAGTYGDTSNYAIVTVDAYGRVLSASQHPVAGGGGTVYSVGLVMPSIFTVTNSPVTTTGNLTATLNTQLANVVFAGPSSGGVNTPTFRALVAADLPLSANAPLSYAAGVFSHNISGAVAGTYNNVTVDTYGHVTGGSNVSYGTVTSVAASFGGSAVTIGGSPITTSGTLAFAWAGTSAQYVAGDGSLITFPTIPTGTVTSVGASITGAAIGITGSPITTSGTLAFSWAGTSAQYVAGNGSLVTFPTIPSGTVTSVGLSMPSIFTVTNSPVTTSGTLTATLATQTANTVFAGPTTVVAAAPTFRALVAADIPSLDTSKITTGLTNQSVVFWNSGFSENTLFNWVTASAYLRIGTSSGTRTSASGLQVAQILLNGGVEFISVATASNTTLMNNTNTAMIYSTTYNAYGVGGGSAGSLVLAARGTNVNVGHYFTAGTGPVVIATFFTNSSGVNYYAFGQALNSTYGTSSYFTINGTVNIGAGTSNAAGVVISNSFTATANNQVLQGLFLNPTFAAGGFTGLNWYIATLQQAGTTYLQLEGTTIAGATVVPRLLLKNGNSTGTVKVGGYVDTYFTDAANSGAGETDLYSYTTPASSLATNGDKITGLYFGNTAANINNKTWKVYFGGTQIFTSAALAVLSLSWEVSVTVIRVSASIVRCTTVYRNGTTTVTNYQEVTGLTLSNTNILKITGQGTSTSDIVAKGGWLHWGPYTT